MLLFNIPAAPPIATPTPDFNTSHVTVQPRIPIAILASRTISIHLMLLFNKKIKNIK